MQVSKIISKKDDDDDNDNDEKFHQGKNIRKHQNEDYYSNKLIKEGIMSGRIRNSKLEKKKRTNPGTEKIWKGKNREKYQEWWNNVKN